MTTALVVLAVAFSYFAGKSRGRGEGFAQGWLVAHYQARDRRGVVVVCHSPES